MKTVTSASTATRKPSTKQKRQRIEPKAVIALSSEHFEMLKDHVRSSIESYLFPVNDSLDDSGLLAAWEAQRGIYVEHCLTMALHKSRKDAESDVRWVDSQVELLKALIEQESAVAVHFTPEQFKRLQGGAKMFGASPEELCIAGALSQLDCCSIPRKKAIFATQCLVEAYAKGRETFLQPEHGTDKPAQFADDGVSYDPKTGVVTMPASLGRELAKYARGKGCTVSQAIIASAEVVAGLSPQSHTGR